MEFRIAVSCIDDDGIEHRRDVLALRRAGLDMALLGLTLTEGKVLLGDLQGYLVERQATS